jgi:universal stress protein A
MRARSGCSPLHPARLLNDFATVFRPVRHFDIKTSMDSIKKILAPTDLSESSGAGLRYALTLGNALGAEVLVYHVVDYDVLTRHGERSSAPASFQPPDRAFLERYETALSQFVEGAASDLLPSVQVGQKVELGRPDTGIVELARTGRYDLIVMSTHGKSGPRMTLGSVTQRIVHTAPCPVLSIRPEVLQP